MNPTYILSILTCCALTACQSLPNLSLRQASHYIPTQSAPQLEASLLLPDTKSSLQPKSPNQNNTHNAQIYVLDHARDAYVARTILLDNAQISLDAQYYIWRDDVSGMQLFRKLWQAAERGVRVRLLLDDNNTRGMDDLLAALNQHPNIQIRLFNPFLHRKWRFLGYLTDFPRLNRRMHNKAMIADNRASIVGGRNIGDEYFDVQNDHAFADMDVLASGEIVAQLSQDFDRYWQSDSAYPIEQIIKNADLAHGQAQLKSSLHTPENPFNHENDIAHSPLAQAQQRQRIVYFDAQTELVSDDPAKALDRRVRVNIAEQMQAALGKPKREVYLVSPYFVPTQTGVNMAQELNRQGIRTTVFTNSLSATDVAAVHSGYARYRRDLLNEGVQLYEFKGDTDQKGLRNKGLTGSSATSLHAKTLIIDRERVFVGSFNLDPRSARLNTEMGLVIHHDLLAQQMQRRLQQEATQSAYHVYLHKGSLHWRDPQTQTSSRHEPEASFWKRLASRIFSWLPIERLL